MKQEMKTDVFIQSIRKLSFDTIQLFNINPKRHRNGFVISVLDDNDQLP